MRPSRSNPEKYIRMLEAELRLTDRWKKDAESNEEQEELDKEWMFFGKLLDAAKMLAYLLLSA